MTTAPRALAIAGATLTGAALTGAALTGPAFADRAAPPLPLPPPPPPGRPVEVAVLGQRIAGAYACKGMQLAPNGPSTPFTAKLTVRLVLGEGWVQMSLAETAPDGVAFEDYRTYDPIAKQWSRFQMASYAMHAAWTSLGETGGAWTWDGAEISQQGTMQIRDHETIGDRQLSLWGEALLGGSWRKRYELTCKR